MTTDSPEPGSRNPEGDADGFSRRVAREEQAHEAGVATEDRPAPPRDQGKSVTRNTIEWIGVVVGAILIALVVRTFVLQTFWIPSPSMASTLVENDRVLVNKLSYEFHDVNRGDVIVFERPPTEQPSAIKDLIKRVVGLPGDHVSVLDGKVLIDGRELEEPYVNGLQTVLDSCPITNVPGIDTTEGFEVPEGNVLVMGDNRVNSHDGRCFGPIDEDLIVGRAFFIMWPPGHAGGL